MDPLSRIAEDKIQRAMEEGLFDNLPGKGKPLRLEENPFEDPTWRMANSLLKGQGFTLPWIEVRKEIQADLEAARRDLAEAELRRQAGGSESAWQTAQQTYQAQIADLNRRILSYNIQAPSAAVHLQPVISRQ